MPSVAPADDDQLRGLRVLVVEDETLVAMLVEDYLGELGCVVAASVNRVAKAITALAANPVDAAILDINVGGDDLEPLVTALDAKRIPFFFASGYGRQGLRADWLHRLVLQKPFDLEQLRDALVKALRP